MQYQYTKLKKEFHISRIYTIHYFEYEKNYGFLGKKHDFWELVYVDKGEILVTAQERQFPLKQGEIVFHQPNEYHNLQANGIVAPNIIIVAFECRSPAMDFFRGRVMHLSDYEKHFLSVILKEASEAYISPLDDTFLPKLEKRTDSLFGCEQLISVSLAQLLIALRRSGMSSPRRSTTTLMKRLSQDVVAEVTDFLAENIGTKLRFSEVAEFAGMSGSSLKTIFRTQTGQGVMAYFTQMKVDRAKSLIREGNYNITQISALLGYDSIHQFSRRFKEITGMSPSEYGKSVKVEFDTVLKEFAAETENKS